MVGPAAAAVLLVRRLRRALDEHGRALGRLAHRRGEAARALDLVRSGRQDVLELVHLDPSAPVLGGVGGREEDPHRHLALVGAGVLGAQAPQERLVVAVRDVVGLGHERQQLVDRRAGVGLEGELDVGQRHVGGVVERERLGLLLQREVLVVDVAMPAPEERVADRGRGVADVARLAAAVRRHHERGDDVAEAVVPDVAPERAGGRLLERAEQLRGQRRGPAPFSAAPAATAASSRSRCASRSSMCSGPVSSRSMSRSAWPLGRSS